MFKNKKTLAARLFGMDIATFNKCSGDMKSKANSVLLSMFILHSFTAIAIALGIGWGVYKNWAIVAIIFPTVLLLLLSIDRLLVTAPRHWTLVFARLMLLFSLPILHVAFFDLVFFESDIKSHYQNNIKIQKEKIDQRYLNLSLDNQLAIETIDSSIQAERDSIIKWQLMKIGELTGTSGTKIKGDGRVYRKQMPHLDALIDQSKEQINKLELRRDLLITKEGRFNFQKHEDKSNLPIWEDTGILERMNLLKEKAWSSDGWMIKLISLAWLAIFLFIDGVMLLPAITKPFLEYREWVAEEKKLAQAIRSFDLTQQEKLNIVELKTAFEQRLLTINTTQRWAEYRAEAASTIQKLNYELKLIDDLQFENGEVSNRYSKDFEKMARVAYIRALDEISELFDRKTSQAM
ncbi:MAG: hypothetical protein DHS20C18_14150 [Saprospiraceae bacterium]|nr:MAG: hypothetical protein DHS20C18_14150 [Saprospiraceae bacterium]